MVINVNRPNVLPSGHLLPYTPQRRTMHGNMRGVRGMHGLGAIKMVSLNNTPVFVVDDLLTAGTYGDIGTRQNWATYSSGFDNYSRAIAPNSSLTLFQLGRTALGLPVWAFLLVEGPGSTSWVKYTGTPPTSNSFTGTGSSAVVAGVFGADTTSGTTSGTVTGSTPIANGQTIDGTKYEIVSGNCPGGKFTLKRPDGTYPDGSRAGDIQIRSSGLLSNGTGTHSEIKFAWCLDFGQWSSTPNGGGNTWEGGGWGGGGNGNTGNTPVNGPCNCPPNCREELQKENRFLNKNKLSDSDIPTAVKVPRIVCPPKVTEFTTTCAEELKAIKQQHGLTGIRRGVSNSLSGCSSCGTKGTSNRFNGRM